MITVRALIENLKDYIIDPIIGLLFALAIFYLFSGILDFFFQKKDLQKAKDHILYGTIGLFVMISVYGLIRIICSTIGVSCS